MRKKILCLAMSVITMLGVMTGCGSSSSTADDNGGSSKVEQTILTELIPGETTAEETLKWFNDNALSVKTNGEWEQALSDSNIPYYSKSSDTFLGYKCFYVLFDYVGADGRKGDYEKGLDDETLSSYVVYVTFKDRDDFKAGKEKIESYIESLSSIKATNEDDNGDTSILIKDEDKYATAIGLYVKDLSSVTNSYYYEGLDVDDCFDTVLRIDYYSNPYLHGWELPDGTKFDLKCKDFVQSNQQ